MPSFGRGSLEQLETCHPLIQELCYTIIKIFDFKVICGYRDQERQNYLKRIHKSKVIFPMSKHNKLPSEAFDFAPCPIDWNDERRFIFLAGIFKGVALEKGILIRWGGDWDGDTQLKDNKFNDYGHIELLKTEKIK